MSSVKKFSHPMLSRTVADIFEQLEHKITPGSTYGQLFYSTSLAFTDPNTTQEKNILVKLCGYGSAITALIESHVYLVSGRLIPLNTKSTPVFHYDSNTIIDLGESAKFTQSLCDKATVIGLGIVVSKKEINGQESSSGSTTPILQVVLQHTDYDPLAKAQVQFQTIYNIGSRKNLANTFGLFQLGREIMISGNIVGYAEENFMWIVSAISVSVTSGHQSSLSQPSQQSNKAQPYTRRPGLISIEDSSTAKLSPAFVEPTAKLGSVVNLGLNPEPSALDPTPVTETASDNYYQTVASTSGKKRTKKAILADAKKALKQ
ncbi:uncharacterized protein PGTG_11583 [Puccinia graminis f. sp. tritici CRL 75-36-700-3]|uniref:Uncharacterized protein n=1 Tax=Puccinia graminis f. sp. tritici (strain CRL 75-36-700-3 / race SCCL) TaxID=418459 RepID=E3KNF2_PUCGT|nr:uncharacterized protein PGTG_11583 [Puccinia graminis f. sp. tritici CRL 75-36-700-3]EFP85827.1 hypothetical protein PGTG_11583 [Puccinia graminis f. sp. tritici CRL 75-36-700-3]